MPYRRFDDLIFVYGTLMRGFANPMARLLADSAEFCGAAWCQGRLYRIAHYPGLLRSDDPLDIVHGELFRMRAPQQVLPLLDDYEGCGPGFAPPTAYLREMMTVTPADGSPLQVWSYIYNWPVMEARRITSGRFVAEPSPDDPEL